MKLRKLKNIIKVKFKFNKKKRCETNESEYKKVK